MVPTLVENSQFFSVLIADHATLCKLLMSGKVLLNLGMKSPFASNTKHVVSFSKHFPHKLSHLFENFTTISAIEDFGLRQEMVVQVV